MVIYLMTRNCKNAVMENDVLFSFNATISQRILIFM